MANTLLPAKIVRNSVQRLGRRSEYFRTFLNVIDWIVNENGDILRVEETYFIQIKNYLLNKYRLQDIYLSPSAMDDIIFFALQKSDPDNLLTNIDHEIRQNQLHKNSIVIFPLHSFGFGYGGLGYLINSGDISITYGNFRVNSQTNSFSKSVSNIKNYLATITFPACNKLDFSLFEHYYKSRKLKWFDQNPLMFLNFRFSQVERYDNVYYILDKVNFTTNKLYFLYALRSEKDFVSSLFSTKTTNNWETLDINHFLTITGNSRQNSINCVPIHSRFSMIYENMHMNIDLKARKKNLHAWEDEAIDSIDFLYKGYSSFLITRNKRFAMYYRIANSLSYFRRSVKAINNEDKVININIAFETLLLDKQESQKKDKMLQRVWCTLKGKINKKENLKNLEDVIAERNEIVHNGLPVINTPNYSDIYKTYCRLILFLKNNMALIDPKQPNYLSDFYSKF